MFMMCLSKRFICYSLTSSGAKNLLLFLKKSAINTVVTVAMKARNPSVPPKGMIKNFEKLKSAK